MQTGRQQSIPLAIAVSSGAGTGTFTKSWDHVNHIRIVPPTEVTQYKVKIKDGDGRMIIANAVDGDASLWTGTLPLSGPYSLGIMNSVEITDATVDGTFYAILDMH